MSISLNEVDAMSKKAARGAGYPWGLAEEAGKAVRFLCANGLDGCAALAEVLERFDGDVCVPALTTEWRAEVGSLCPLTLGAALSDRAGVNGPVPITCRDIVQPLLLLPFAANIAKVRRSVVAVSVGSTTCMTDGTLLAMTGKMPAEADIVTVSQGHELPHALPQRSRAHPTSPIWEKLNAFAHRTYAPATEESRRKGAG